MGLDQFLYTDQYFSETWEDTKSEAKKIVKLAKIPPDLVDGLSTVVRIKLMQWHKCHWFNDFIYEAAQASQDFQEIYIDSKVLNSFIERAEKIINYETNPDTGSPYRIWELFPYPGWLDSLGVTHNQSDLFQPTYSNYDYEILTQTRDKFKQILKEIPNVDLVYRVSV